MRGRTTSDVKTCPSEAETKKKNKKTKKQKQASVTATGAHSFGQEGQQKMHVKS